VAGADQLTDWKRIALEGICAMLRKTMIVLATAAALSAGLTADAFARGGGGGGGDAESRQGQIPC